MKSIVTSTIAAMVLMVLVGHSVSVALALTTQTINFGKLDNKMLGAAPFTITVTASSGLPVTFVSTTPGICTVSGSRVTLAGAGTCTIRASQAGNSIFAAAPNVDQSMTVFKANQSITFATLADKTLDATPITVSATASSGLPVTFTSITAAVCTIAGAAVTFGRDRHMHDPGDTVRQCQLQRSGQRAPELHGNSHCPRDDSIYPRCRRQSHRSAACSVSLLRGRRTAAMRSLGGWACRGLLTLLVSIGHAQAALTVGAIFTNKFLYDGMPAGVTLGSPQAVCAFPFGPGVWSFVSSGASTAVPCNPDQATSCHVGWCDYAGVHKVSVIELKECPPGSTYNGIDHRCYIDIDPRKECPGDRNDVGNPINCGSGVKRQAETDLDTGSFTFTRTFASYVWWKRGDAFGPGWSSNWHSRRVRTNVISGGSLIIEVDRGNGRSVRVLPTSTAMIVDADVADRLTELKDGQGIRTGWSYYDAASENTEVFDAAGRVLNITTRSGATTTFGYNGSNQLATVIDAVGRRLTFDYDSTGRVIRMTDPNGGLHDYGYDALGNLASVTRPVDAQGVRTRRLYHYENASYPNFLTGVTDENGWRHATFAYDAMGRAFDTRHHASAGVDVDRHAINYTTPYAQVVVTDPLGTSRTYSQTTKQYVVRTTGLSQPCPACGSVNAAAIAYDNHGNTISRTDFNGNKTCFGFDTSRNLEVARTEGLLSSESCSAVPNRPDVRRTTTAWHPTFRLPASITEPAPGGSKTTAFTYDGSGNRLQKSVTAPKNDGTGSVVTQIWSWTYATRGRMLTATDPRGKVTTYAYYADTDPDPGKRGNVATITNPLGHVTQISAYDAGARPQTLIDPNGLITNLTYDARGRLKSRTVGGETTGYDYDGVGQLKRVTLPDGSYIAYTYDGAHRLTEIRDGLGHRIVYTLDAMGNRLKEEAFDPANTLTRTHGRQFDALSRLTTDLGALNQSTAYGYDNNANLISVTDPLSHATGNSYDALNRLTQVVDANLGVTRYAYDPTGNLTQVTDPRNLATTYTYDGFGNLTRQGSPDTGTTINTFDAAGNLLGKTDARGVTATHTYDDLSRVTQIVYSKAGSPSETHTFTYDAGVNAKGRLTRMNDAAGVTAWTYTAQGRVASKTQTVDGLTRATTHGYNGAGQLTSLTTPSGQTIGYGYLNNRIASITVNGQRLLAEVGTEPFGPLAAWQWGNGLKTFRDYDTDGRLAAWELRNGVSLIRKQQTFDPANRITAIGDPLAPAASQGYEYDVLDRLSAARSGNPVTRTQQFGYDAVGNRQTLTVGSALTNLTYETGSNRLQTLTGAPPANYALGSGSWTFTYNLANRLVAAVSNNLPLATYRVNALGQRVSKTVAGATTSFVYDEQGRLLGEYDGTGNLIQETIWLEDLPVATLRPTGSGNPTPIAIYYVHADHLGSPRAITRPADNVTMWQWDNLDPFGANLANENPTGRGAFKYGLRFPGQYFDAETGTHYNYFRDYDPTIGRYEQSDPIGLKGGTELTWIQRRAFGCFG